MCVPIPCGISSGSVDANDPDTETLLSRAFPHSAHLNCALIFLIYL